MKVLVLIHGGEEAWNALSESDQHAVRAQYGAFAEHARAAGKLLGGDELASTDRATTVRVRNGDTIVTDGPYAETREALGGYFLLECESMEEAVELAKQLPKPAGPAGGIEVRPAYEEEGEEL